MKLRETSRQLAYKTMVGRGASSIGNLLLPGGKRVTAVSRESLLLLKQWLGTSPQAHHDGSEVTNVRKVQSTSLGIICGSHMKKAMYVYRHCAV
jgi:hypothetical protein